MNTNTITSLDTEFEGTPDWDVEFYDDQDERDIGPIYDPTEYEINDPQPEDNHLESEYEARTELDDREDLMYKASSEFDDYGAGQDND